MVVLSEGIYLQVFRSKIPGATHQARMDWCAKHLDESVALGVKGIAWHGFPGEMTPDNYLPLAHLCRDRDLLTMAAYGLNTHHPEANGQAIGTVLALPECDGGLLDAEGAFDQGAHTIAEVLCGAIRAKAPHALIGDQPWFAPTLHSGFPYEEFSKCVGFHAPQVYVNDFIKKYGTDRYDKVWPWYQKSWSTLETGLFKKGLIRPHVPTIQAYAWKDIPNDLDHCLTVNPSLICWCEPWPDASFLEGLKRLQTRLKDPSCRTA